MSEGTARSLLLRLIVVERVYASPPSVSRPDSPWTASGPRPRALSSCAPHLQFQSRVCPAKNCPFVTFDTALQASPRPDFLSRGKTSVVHRRPKTEGDARRCTAYSSSAAPGTGRPPSAASRGGASRAPAPAARAGPAAAGATGGRTGRPRAAMSGESFHGAGGIARCCPSVRSVASARPGPAEGVYSRP